MAASLDVICVGRNEVKHIPALAESLRHIRATGTLDGSAIYVDSASSDGSFERACADFDEVYVLAESPWLCAAAGRAIGTVKAKAEWILYLDADMTLRPEFAHALKGLLKAANADIQGYVGSYLNVYSDGTTAETTFGTSSGIGPARRIGGAVLLRRHAVLEAGNWEAALFSHEEIDLYARLKNGTKCVTFIPLPMVEHYTERRSAIENLKMNFLPWGGLGKKYYGIGQLLALRWQSPRILVGLWRLMPEATLTFVVFGLIVVSLFVLDTSWAALAVFVLVTALTVTVPLGVLATLCSWIPQAICGVWKSNRTFVPRVSVLHINDNAKHIAANVSD